MIINYLIGGLGNQLFQIAAGYSHSLNMKTSYAINYNFNLGYGQGNHPSKYKNSIFKKIKQTNRNFFRMYDQPGFAFSTIPLMDEICLRGYFQSDKYFKKNETAIRNLFEFPDDIKIKVNNKNFKFNKKKKYWYSFKKRGLFKFIRYPSTCNKGIYTLIFEIFR